MKAKNEIPVIIIIKSNFTTSMAKRVSVCSMAPFLCRRGQPASSGGVDLSRLGAGNRSNNNNNSPAVLVHPSNLYKCRFAGSGKGILRRSSSSANKMSFPCHRDIKGYADDDAFDCRNVESLK